MNCKTCGREVLLIPDGRILLKFKSDHTNNINGKSCGGVGEMAVRPEREPAQDTVVEEFPSPCSGCARPKMRMKYTGESTALYSVYCERCDKT